MPQPARSRLTKEEIEQIAHDEAVGRAPTQRHSEIEANDRKQYQAALRENGPYLTLGMQMAMTIGLGAAVGWWIDRSNDTSIWLGLGAGAGAVLGMTYFILVVVRMEGRRKQSEKRSS
jgi:hypothetical protein